MIREMIVWKLNLKEETEWDDIVDLCEGRLDPFILQYRRNSDGSLSFIENTVSVNSGHLYDLLGEEC